MSMLLRFIYWQNKINVPTYSSHEIYDDIFLLYKHAFIIFIILSKINSIIVRTKLKNASVICFHTYFARIGNYYSIGDINTLNTLSIHWNQNRNIKIYTHHVYTSMPDSITNSNTYRHQTSNVQELYSIFGTHPNFTQYKK